MGEGTRINSVSYWQGCHFRPHVIDVTVGKGLRVRVSVPVLSDDPPRDAVQANISFPVFYLKTVVMRLLGLSPFVPILWLHHAFWVSALCCWAELWGCGQCCVLLCPPSPHGAAGDVLQGLRARRLSLERLEHPQGMAPARSPWEGVDASSSFSPSFCFWEVCGLPFVFLKSFSPLPQPPFVFLLATSPIKVYHSQGRLNGHRKTVV